MIKKEVTEIVATHTFEKEDISCDFILRDGFVNGVTSSSNYHFHSFFEIHYVIKGNMHMVIDDRDIYLGCGDLCIIPPKKVHYIYQDENSHRVGFRFSFRQVRGAGDECFYERFRRAYSALEKAHILKDEFFFSQCLNVSREALARKAPDYMAEELLFMALNALSYSLAPCDSDKEDSLVYTDSFVTEYIEDYLNEHYQGIPRLGELANALKLSVRQTQRVIWRLFGMNFSDLVTARRLTVARFLLCKTSLSMEEIALQSGFCDKPYFYRKFSSYYGMTPLRYRKNGGENAEAEAGA